MGGTHSLRSLPAVLEGAYENRPPLVVHSHFVRTGGVREWSEVGRDGTACTSSTARTRDQQVALDADHELVAVAVNPSPRSNGYDGVERDVRFGRL